VSVLAEQKARNDDAAPFPLLGVVRPAHRGAGERGEAATGGVGAWWTAGTWVLGTLFATAAALWIAVLGVALLPRLITWCARFLRT